jgi:hypothetical protein
VSNEPEGASQSGGGLPDIHVNTGLTLGALAVGLLAGLAVTRWPVLVPVGAVMAPLGDCGSRGWR